MEPRFQALVDAGIALTSELSLDAVLQKLVETAAELTGARYAALGVIDRDRRGLERFLTTGIDPDTQAAIGELPKGRGLLGALIDDARPLRLHDIADDPRSVGFPPNHPPMKSFLGVPVLLRGYAYGNLYLSEKENREDFTQGDQDVVTLLASQAAVAIENARLYESATRWLRQLESLIEVGNALSMELDLDRLLDLVARRLRELVGARLVLIALPKPDGKLGIEAADGDGAAQILGVRLDAEASKMGRVLERRRSERVDSMIDDIEVDQETARRVNAMTGLYVPLTPGVARSAWSPSTTRPVRTRGSARRTCGWSRRSGPRVHGGRPLTAGGARHATSRHGRAGARAPPARPRAPRRDRPGAHVAAAWAAGRGGGGRGRAPRAARGGAGAHGRDTPGRAAARGRAAAEGARRLRARARAGAPRCDVHRADGHPRRPGGDARRERLPPETETALYRITQEALTNVVKHAHATRVSIVLTRKDASVTAVIEDDGRGFDPGSTREGGYGLLGMRERVELIGGRLDIEANDAGTTVVAEVPLLS